ncbi:MAG: iron-sulfur cluster assembly accessory protein [bacterium]|nr:iron-sulfur cluster assembly accessory protein [bacterium]
MGITITQSAAVKIKDAFKANDMPENACLRLGIKGGGCSGFSYTLDVSAEPAEGDELFECQGVRLICDPKSYLYLNGTEVDFSDDLLKGGFIFNNPNAKASCGCGASFSA